MENRIRFLRLLLGCQYIHPVENCPVEKYRNYSVVELIEFMNGVSDEELVKILSGHNLCNCERTPDRVPCRNHEYA
jgi:hypothetical protein